MFSGLRTGRAAEIIGRFNQRALRFTRAGPHWIPAAIRIGLLMPVINIAPFAVLLLLRGIVLGPSPELPVDTNPTEGFGPVVVGPVFETLFIVLIHRLARARLGLTGFVLVTAVLAAAAHAPVKTLPPIGPAVAFAIMAYQYASFREQLGVEVAFWGVALAHAVNNGVVIAVILIAGLLE